MTIPLPRVNSVTMAGAAALLLVVLDPSAAAEVRDKGEPQTALAKLAATMQPGQWAELKTNGLAMKVFSDGGHHALQYTDEAVFHHVFLPRRLLSESSAQGKIARVPFEEVTGNDANSDSLCAGSCVPIGCRGNG